MAKDVTVGIVKKLRQRIICREYTESLPTERTLAREMCSSRVSLRIALAQLSAEGLIKAVPGKRWRVLSLTSEAGFELFTNTLELLEPAKLEIRVAELLAFRSRHFVAAIDSLVTARDQPSA